MDELATVLDAARPPAAATAVIAEHWSSIVVLVGAFCGDATADAAANAVVAAALRGCGHRWTEWAPSYVAAVSETCTTGTRPCVVATARCAVMALLGHGRAGADAAEAVVRAVWGAFCVDGASATEAFELLTAAGVGACCVLDSAVPAARHVLRTTGKCGAVTAALRFLVLLPAMPAELCGAVLSGAGEGTATVHVLLAGMAGGLPPWACPELASALRAWWTGFPVGTARAWVAAALDVDERDERLAALDASVHREGDFTRACMRLCCPV